MAGQSEVGPTRGELPLARDHLPNGMPQRPADLELSEAPGNCGLGVPLSDLSAAGPKLLQHEKLAIIGRMAADAAHETRDPLARLGLRSTHRHSERRHGCTAASPSHRRRVRRQVRRPLRTEGRREARPPHGRTA